jgi:hypothetical protein
MPMFSIHAQVREQQHVCHVLHACTVRGQEDPKILSCFQLQPRSLCIIQATSIDQDACIVRVASAGVR